MSCFAHGLLLRAAAPDNTARRRFSRKECWALQVACRLLMMKSTDRCTQPGRMVPSVPSGAAYSGGTAQSELICCLESVTVSVQLADAGGVQHPRDQ